MTDVSIIIVSYKSVNEILANIDSIKRNIRTLKYEILVVNNYAVDKGLSDALKNYGDVTVIEAGSNLGFGRANNLGLEAAKGRFVLFVNPDVIFLSDIDRLTEVLENDRDIGLIGPITYDGKGRIMPSCGEYPSVKNFLSFNLFFNNLFPKVKWWGNFSMKYFDFNETRDVDWISGAFMLGRKSVLKRIGGFDKDFFMYNEDIDICWRLKKSGFKVVFSDKASIIHNVGHAARNKSVAKAKMIAESNGVLWNKHYSQETVKKLTVILCLGSFIRKTGWKLLSLMKKTGRKNMSEYYDTLITESLNYLKE
ncbi:MAG TPA: glycosyltransferase family 2 protein [Clostridia bacterium]|nr:glycosyltransferase family 2 protein [Clostridia bacterium]